MTSKGQAARILVLDDDQQTRSLVRMMLHSCGFTAVFDTDCPKQALFKVESGCVDLILCDWHMPKMEGVEFLQEVRKLNKGIPFIMVTSEGRTTKVMEAIQGGVTDYVVKPFRTDEMVRKIERALR